MGLTLTYKNSLGSVIMQGGGGSSPLRITAIEGLGLATREYITAVYTGYDGQETTSSRATSRSITIAVEVAANNITAVIHNTLDVLSQSGMLYIDDGTMHRRIMCNQVQIPDIERVLRSQIATFAVQFVCDSPYFEDGEDTVVPLYRRTKGLSTPFTLPRSFGEIVAGGVVENKGSIPIEPIITIYYPSALDGIDGITLKNETTGKVISLDYSPTGEDTVVIDVKNRKITSKIAGSLLNNLSDDTFLGDFVLERGNNEISVDLGDVAKGFGIECKFSNLYSEAVIC